MTQPRDLWTDLRSGFWFVPVVGLEPVLVEGTPELHQGPHEPNGSWRLRRHLRLLLGGAANDRQRTVDQDAAHGIRQLVDVALRGLSPGTNDTTTAIMCVDYLTAILARLAHRQLDTPGLSEAGELQVIVRRPTYADFVAEAFDQIRQNADGNVAVMRRLIHSLETLSRITPDNERRRVLFLHVEAVREMIQRSVQSHRERSELESHATRLSESLNASS